MFPSTGLYDNYYMTGGMTPHTCDYNSGTMAFGILATIASNIFCQAYGSDFGSGWGSYSGGSSSSGSSSSSSVSQDPYAGSTYSDDIKNKKNEIAAIENEVAKDSELQKAVDTARENLEIFNDYKKAKEDFENLTKPKEKNADGTDNPNYKEEKAKYDEVESAYKKAKEKLENAGMSEKTTEGELNTALTNAEEKLKKENENLDQLKKDLKNLQQQAESELGLSSALNKKDGSWLNRKIDRKGATEGKTIKDRMAAFRKASDKFMQNPYSLTDTEIETLKDAANLKNDIEKSDNTDSAKAVINGLDTWINNEKKREQLDRAKKAYEGKITKKDFDELKKYNFFKQSERKVTQNGNTRLETIYTGGGHSYIVDDNNSLIKLEQTQNGNLLHKSEYKIK